MTDALSLANLRPEPGRLAWPVLRGVFSPTAPIFALCLVMG